MLYQPPGTALKLTEEYPDSIFVQQHSPRGSHVMDAFWSDAKYPVELRESKRSQPKTESAPPRPQSAASLNMHRAGNPFGENRPLPAADSLPGVLRPPSATRPTSAATSLQGSRRPPSAAHSLPGLRRAGRPVSAVPNRTRPCTAPNARRPDSAVGKKKKGSKGEPPMPEGPVWVTKNAKELRDEYVAKCRQQAALNPKYLKTKMEEGDLTLRSEASTELLSDDESDASGDSDDSELDDFDRLQRAFKKIRRITATAEAAVAEQVRLKEENEKHLAEIESLNEALAALEEKNEFLQESEDRWRKLNSELRIEKEGNWLELERARMNRCDLEDRCRPLDLHMAMVNKTVRRWTMAFDRVGDLIEHRGSKAKLKLMWQAWCSEVEFSKAQKEWEMSDDTLRLKIEEIKDLKLRIQELEKQLEDIPALQAALEDANKEILNLQALRLETLKKIFSPKNSVKKVFNGWMNAVPAIQLERQYEDLTETHAELQIQFEAVSKELAALKKWVEEDIRGKELEDSLNRQGMLNEDLKLTSDCSAARLSKIQSLKLQNEVAMKAAEERLRAREKVLKAEIEELDDAWQQKYREAEEQHAEERQRLLLENDELEARVDDLLEALYPEGASGEGRASRPPRVVPRSQGVLCAGCMIQILHRDVRPIDSAVELEEAILSRLAKEREAFCDNALGAPRPCDPSHAFLFSRRKDPPKGLNGSKSETNLRPRSAVQHPRSRPHSAAAGSPKKSSTGGRADALRAEIAGFRSSWRG